MSGEMSTMLERKDRKASSTSLATDHHVFGVIEDLEEDKREWFGPNFFNHCFFVHLGGPKWCQHGVATREEKEDQYSMVIQLLNLRWFWAFQDGFISSQ